MVLSRKDIRELEEMARVSNDPEAFKRLEEIKRWNRVDKAKADPHQRRLNIV